ncbi:MAG: hypothetical protein BMS9Abin32_379 [Gammaproteobacteria bacterium]|nr:MAG: hypothetical protein BMS9Abin32_379 [Gammaproteobacteria bacterium]
MTTSANRPCTGARDEATTQDHERFIDRHRLLLLRYLDGTAPASAEEPDALGYVESVLGAWLEIFGKSKLADPSPHERTFWFALYLLEELVETPGPHIDPYEKLLLEHLAEVRALLRHRQPLPEHRFMATRPDGR